MKRYQASKFFGVTIALIILGIVAMLVYLVQLTALLLAPQLTEQNLDSLRYGQYVRVTMQQFLVGEYGAVRENIYDNSKIYQVMVIPVGQDRCLEVGIGDPASQVLLEEYQDGKGEPFSFAAKVEKQDGAMREDNLSWYDHTEADKRRVITTYRLMEISTKDFRFYFIIGVGGLTAALICFLTVGGIQTVYVRPFEDSSTYRDCFYGRIYNLDARLEREKANLETVLKQQREASIFYPVGIGSLLVGLFVGLIGFVLDFAPVQPLGLLVGCYLIVAGIKGIWEGFINSKSPLAYRISDLFLIRSAPVRIEEISKLIAALNHAIREQEKKGLRFSEESSEYGNGD